MKCPKCRSNATRVTFSMNDQTWVKRRRVCKECSHKFNTIEVDSDKLSEVHYTILQLIDNYPDPEMQAKLISVKEALDSINPNPCISSNNEDNFSYGLDPENLTEWINRAKKYVIKNRKHRDKEVN